MKHAIMSNCKDPQNRSDKNCCCGGHSAKAKRSKKNKIARVKLDGAMSYVYTGKQLKDN